MKKSNNLIPGNNTADRSAILIVSQCMNSFE